MLVVVAALCCAATAIAQERAPQPAPSASRVTFNDGRLTVSARSAALVDVLAQVSKVARLAFVAVDDLSTARVSAAFENLPLEEGLRLLLKDYDTFVYFGVGQRPPSSPQVVWVYQPGRGRGVAPVPPEAWASTGELRQLLTTSPDPDERAEVIESLIDRSGDRAQDAVQWALGDVDARVRSRALYAAINSGVELSAELLMQALNDVSRDVRFLALEGLAAGPEARAAAERARSDLDPAIQRQAQQILERLTSATRPASAGPSR